MKIGSHVALSIDGSSQAHNSLTGDATFLKNGGKPAFDVLLREANSLERESVSLRQSRMLEKNSGYNISPEAWFSNYRSIGQHGTYVTDYRAIGEILGPVRANMKFDVGLFTRGSTVSYFKVSKLEHALGLRQRSLYSGFRISRVAQIREMHPRSPLGGNSFFTTPGGGLPDGAPELVVDSLLTKAWPKGLSRYD